MEMNMRSPSHGVISRRACPSSPSLVYDVRTFVTLLVELLAELLVELLDGVFVLIAMTSIQTCHQLQATS